MNRPKRQTWIRGAALLAVVLTSTAALGQSGPSAGGGAASAPSSVVEEVKTRFDAGLAALDRKDWKKAADELGKAYALCKAHALKPLPQIAGNLAEAELKLGRYRDAAEHAEKFLREFKGASTQDKKDGKAWLDESKKHIVTLKITVEGTGVEVLINGKVVGVSPLPPEVYVDPGKHTVEARSGSARDEATDTYEAGWVRVMNLVPKEPAVVGPVATASGTTTAPTGTEKPAGAPFPVRTVALASGGAVALVGIGLGITGLVLSNLKAAERDEFCEKAADRCLTPESVDKELFDRQKSEWQQLDKDRVSTGNLGIAGLVVGGIAAVGTGAAFFLWKPSSSKSDAKHGLVIAPAGTGLVVRGKW